MVLSDNEFKRLPRLPTSTVFPPHSLPPWVGACAHWCAQTIVFRTNEGSSLTASLLLDVSGFYFFVCSSTIKYNVTWHPRAPLSLVVTSFFVCGARPRVIDIARSHSQATGPPVPHSQATGPPVPHPPSVKRACRCGTPTIWWRGGTVGVATDSFPSPTEPLSWTDIINHVTERVR